ncbi:MAG: ABC transporter substrate-binding protein [Hyphomicrobiaceae bacterium]
MNFRNVVRATCALSFACALAPSLAWAQKSGGTLRTYNSSNPPSASILEEATVATAFAFSGVFNNLMIYDQSAPINSVDVIQPELATKWAWDTSRTRFTVELRKGVKWHDDKPFTAKDVKCTWDALLGRSKDAFRKNPRKLWWGNVKEIVLDGDHKATFVLAKPQASLVAKLASNLTPIYPCHVSTRDMRTKPIGTGPFKFVAFEANSAIRLTRNAEYWKPGKPYLDGIEIRIVGNRATRLLAFNANEFDLTFVADVTAPLMKDLLARSPDAICKLVPTGVSANLLVNRDKEPFNNPKLRQAMTLALDRDAMISIVQGGKARKGGAMLAPPEGKWGLPAEELAKMPSYAGTAAERQQQARKLMQDAGYGPDKRLKVKVATRDFQSYKDPALLLVDQLNQIYFDAELEIIESSLYYGRVTRGDYMVALNLTGAGIDEPDVTIGENYPCKSQRNYTRYCNNDVDALIDKQSQEFDTAKRKQIVWQIERIMAADAARPIIYHGQAATCWHPRVKGITLHGNSIYNNWRLDSVWLEK